MEENNKSFEAYFHGKMSVKEALDFQTALQTNPDLNSDYEFYGAVKRAFSDIRKDELRVQLEDIDLKNKTKMQPITTKTEKTASTKVFTVIKSAIGIAALFIIGFWGYQAAQSAKIDYIFAQNFEAYTAQLSRGADDNTLSEVYNRGSYERFITQGDEVEKTPEIYLMYANVYLIHDQVEFAISSLKDISDESTYRDQKYWYLGLANLKNGNFTEAKKHFSHLQSISNFKKQEISKILSEIND